MQFTPIPLGFGFYQSLVSGFASQRCINWLPVVAEGPALNGKLLQQMPGIDLFGTLPAGEQRGAHLFNGVPYFVVGDSLYKMATNGTYDLVSDGIEGVGRVSIACNATYLVIVVPGGKGYAFSIISGELSEITSENYYPSNSVSHKDGFFVFTKTQGDLFFNSALNDPLTFNALDIGSAEVNPDKIVTQIVNRNELFILGEETIEVFQNVGGSGFPFQRIQGANIPKGCHSKFGVVPFDNTFSFVGGGLNERTAIWQVNSTSSAVKISTDLIDAQIQRFTSDEIASAFAGTFTFGGQILAFYTFESTRIESRTFVYNATASQLTGSRVWFELSSGVSGGRWNINAVVNAYGEILLGDKVSGKVGKLNTETPTDFGEPNLRQMTTTPFSQPGLPVFAGSLEVLFSNEALTSGFGSAPVAGLEFSDDGGNTWSSQTTRPMGKKGQYNTRCTWNRQGRFPVSRIIRVSVTDPVKANVLRMGATPEAGY